MVGKCANVSQKKISVKDKKKVCKNYTTIQENEKKKKNEIKRN